MITEFVWKKWDKNNVPVIKDVDIEDLAEKLLEDYKPILLKEPTRIKFEHFLESYLGANLDYQNIYSSEKEDPILGLTSFNNIRLKVVDKESHSIKTIDVEKNTIVLDLYVTEEGREGLELFTGLHEAGHYLLHPRVFAVPEGQRPLFEKLDPIMICKRSEVGHYGRRQGPKTRAEWLEHQANYFASAIAMPRATFKPLVRDTLKSYGITEGYVLKGQEDFLVQVIVKAYGVSKAAACVRLEKLDFFKEKGCSPTLF